MMRNCTVRLMMRCFKRERRWFVLERPRRDTNGGSETEVTVTSKLPSKYRKKQGDRKETEKRREGRILWGLRQRLDELRERVRAVMMMGPHHHQGC